MNSDRQLFFDISGEIKRSDKYDNNEELISVLNHKSVDIQREIESVLMDYYGLKNVKVELHFEKGSILVEGWIILGILGNIAGAINFFEYVNKLIKHIRRISQRAIIRNIHGSQTNYRVSINIAPVYIAPIDQYPTKLFEVNKLINEESKRLITWALSIIGGSILIVISTDYVKPTGCILYSYFLFAIGWIFLGLSIWFGETLTRNFIASAVHMEGNSEKFQECSIALDKKFKWQINCFINGIIPFAIWLVLFLIWYIMSKK